MMIFALLLITSLALAADDANSWVRTRILRESLNQAEKMTPDWHIDQRDCAGFVRFLYRKALGTQHPIWRDRAKNKKDFVSAGELVANNFRFLSRSLDKSSPRTGDLLVYKRVGVLPDDAWHLMIILEAPQGAAGKHLAVYHNGEKPDGAVRKVWLDDLSQPEAGQWQASPGNKNFMGVYRWIGMQ